MTAGMLSVRGLTAGYRGRPVVRDVTLPDIEPGEIVALVGPNAAGKSTLLRALAGLLPASSGTIRLGAVDLVPLSLRQRATHVTFMPQALPQGVGLNVLEAVISALRSSPLEIDPADAGGIRRRAASVLDSIGIGSLALETLDHLSGGQRQLVGLAQAIVRQPKLLLLDEPTSARDLRHQLEVMGVVRTLSREGRIVVVVLHDLTLAARWADRIIVLSNGMIATSGPPATALTAETLETVYGVHAHIHTWPDGTLGVTADRPTLQGGH